MVVSKKPSPNTEPVKVEVLHEGSYFGGVPIFFNNPSHITVTAATALTCLVMDRLSFQEKVVPILRFIEKNAQAYHAFINSVEK